MLLTLIIKLLPGYITVPHARFCWIRKQNTKRGRHS